METKNVIDSEMAFLERLCPGDMHGSAGIGIRRALERVAEAAKFERDTYWREQIMTQVVMAYDAGDFDARSESQVPRSVRIDWLVYKVKALLSSNKKV
jgi:hypothetical protein